MKTAWTVLGTAGVAAGLCLIFANPATRAEGPSQPSRYGVVDLGEVMRNFSEVKEMQDQLKGRADAFKKEGEARQQKIEEIRFSRDQEHPDSPKWFEQQQQLNRLTVELELWGKFQKQDIQAASRQQQSAIYKKILRAVETVAKRRGLEAVFQLDGVDLNNPDELITSQRMTIRSVVFASPAIDLTKEVMARVNQASGKQTKSSK